MLALLLSMAFAGQTKVDFNNNYMHCPEETPSIQVRLGWRKAGSSQTTDISQSDWHALLDEAEVSRAAWEAEADLLLGKWWDSIPAATAQDPDPIGTLWDIFEDIAAR